MSDKHFRRWDIFCRVIDNYGDIGVCWRLARQLTSEHGLSVRLWVDDLTALMRIWPSAQHSSQQILDGVEICQWGEDIGTDIVPANVVIEAFACELPPSYVAAMAVQKQVGDPPRWFNLEYLSAEAWVEGCHGLVSVHPSTGLKKVFFFPGFTDKTGGLLREKQLVEERDAFVNQPHVKTAWLAERGVYPQKDQMLVSLFAYENAMTLSLLQAWQESPIPILCLVPDGKILTGINQALEADLRVGDQWQRGQLTLKVLPFLMQLDYDRLLWACDMNFVRGEDSFVRAQWAQKPFVWHIYPQDDDAHLIKLDAFLSRYTQFCTSELKTTTEDLWHFWNKPSDSRLNGSEVWPKVLKAQSKWVKNAQNWAETQNSLPDLTSQIVHFCQKTL